MVPSYERCGNRNPNSILQLIKRNSLYNSIDSIGIATTSQDEKLHIGNGNIFMHETKAESIRMNTIYFIAVTFIVLAACLPVICLVSIKRNKNFRAKAIETTGLIFYVEKRHGSRSTYYIIKIRYKTINTGIEYTGETVFGNKKKVGEEIAIWYKADDPGIFKTDTRKWMRWALAFSLLFFGLICWLSIWLLNQTYTYRPE